MGKPQTFRSPTAVVVWVVWLLFAVANWIDLAVQGRDHLSAVAAAILLLVTGVFYVTAQRPRLVADDAGVMIRNPLRDYRIGWARVAKVDLVDLLRVHCDGGPGGKNEPGGKKQDKVISSWAVHYSRRRQFTADVKARRAARPRRPGLGSLSGRPGLSHGAGAYGAAPATHDTSPEAEAQKIARLLTERSTAARAEAVWADGTAPAAETKAAETKVTETKAPADRATAVAGWSAPLTSTWSGWAIAALVIPALIVLIVWLL